MKIRFEATPNPSTFRFSPIQALSAPWSDQVVEFKTPQDAQFSPMAKKLFGFPWAESVLIGQDFVSISKKDWVDWEVIAEPLASLIEEHMESGQPFAVARPTQSSAAAGTTHAGSSSGASHSGIASERLGLGVPLSTDERQIVDLLNQQIRPMVAMDGGDVEFVRYQDSVVQLRLKGSCAGCPSSTATLKQGIEVRLKQALPQIKEVVSV